MATIETGHTDVIHDAQLDYYAKQLATASSDHSIRIFINNVLSATLKDHTAPVWTLSWAHPTHSGLLASGAYDGTVCIWHPSNWSCIYKHKFHSQSVNSIQWGPLDAGCVLACASSDGTVSLLVGSVEGTWSSSSFNAHQVFLFNLGWCQRRCLVKFKEIGYRWM